MRWFIGWPKVNEQCSAWWSGASRSSNWDQGSILICRDVLGWFRRMVIRTNSSAIIQLTRRVRLIRPLPNHSIWNPTFGCQRKSWTASVDVSLDSLQKCIRKAGRCSWDIEVWLIVGLIPILANVSILPSFRNLRSKAVRRYMICPLISRLIWSD